LIEENLQIENEEEVKYEVVGVSVVEVMQVELRQKMTSRV
jgi:hypothetical protein